jgi:glycosyltransferase involved in cell wall biosynthesis
MPRIDLLTIRPSHSTHDVVVDDWITTDDEDPQICFDRPLRAGWYRFSLDIESDGEIEPQVYFDMGGGFSEAFSVRLHRAANAHVFEGVVKFPAPATRLRLDPINRQGRFLLRSFVAERLGSARLALRLAKHGFSVMLADPAGFAVRLPTYIDALRRPYFLKLPDPATVRKRTTPASYRDWIAQKDFDSERDSVKLRQTIEGLENTPLISVVMPVYNTPERPLREAIESVCNQIYDNWQLCIADDCSTKSHVRRILTEYASRDRRIKVTYRPQNGHISEATNSAFELADGEWIALLDHDDVLRPHALAEVALEVARHPEAELIYSDEDKLDAWGRRYDPYFKPDFSRELFRSQNYLNHLTVHRAANIRAVGGWRRGFEGSQDYDLNLRVLERVNFRNVRHIPKILYHWRALEGSTASAGDEKSYAYEAGLRALKEHVTRMGLDATVVPAPDTPFYRLRFAVPEPAPLVSLIVPTRDKVELLRGCIESILTKTTYAPYEIIVVDNGSVEEETLAYLKDIGRLENVRVLSWRKPFNYSAINNFAVAKAKGTILGLINNDIEVISPDWLTEMVSWAVQDDVGCVGAKLYYADDTIQHAGVILGIGGVAGHAHLGLPRGSPGYFGRAVVLGNFSAVTGACLIVRKSVYEKAGGLDVENLKVAFNDVDFSLKVRRLGLQNVWTPYAELYHLESASRGREDSEAKRERFLREVKYMITRWGNELGADPYYSPNLTRTRGDFSIGDK